MGIESPTRKQCNEISTMGKKSSLKCIGIFAYMHERYSGGCYQCDDISMPLNVNINTILNLIKENMKTWRKFFHFHTISDTIVEEFMRLYQMMTEKDSVWSCSQDTVGVIKPKISK